MIKNESEKSKEKEFQRGESYVFRFFVFNFVVKIDI